MHRTITTKGHGLRKGSRMSNEVEQAVFGNLSLALNRSRVMATNYFSSFACPADLDAFLLGFARSS